MLFQKLRKTKEHIPTKVIAVIGTKEGCGTTHFCISFANYLTNVKGKKVAVAEMGKRTSLGYLAKSGQVIENQGFVIKGITFFEGCNQERLTYILMKEYDFCILDITGNYEEYREEFLRSSLSVVVCSTCLWEIHITKAILSKIHEDEKIKKIVYLYFHGSKYQERKVSGLVESPFVKIPNEEDVFRISGDNFPFYKKIFEQIK